MNPGMETRLPASCRTGEFAGVEEVSNFSVLQPTVCGACSAPQTVIAARRKPTQTRERIALVERIDRMIRLPIWDTFLTVNKSYIRGAPDGNCCCEAPPKGRSVKVVQRFACLMSLVGCASHISD